MNNIDTEESELITHARYELTKAGLFDADSDYNGMLAPAVMEIIEVFSKQGHSGYSASMVIALTQKLMRYENITPLTEDPDEWMLVDGGGDIDTPLYQSRRRSDAFSHDGGKTYYFVDNHDVFFVSDPAS